MSGNATPAADNVSVASSDAYVEARKKAKLGAKLAAEASMSATKLVGETRKAISAQQLQDLKLPCSPVSASGKVAETIRAVAADYVMPSPWCAQPSRPALTVPTNDAQLARFDELSKVGLAALTMDGRALSYEDAIMLERILTGSRHNIQQLDLARALTAGVAPPPPADLIKKDAEELADSIGSEEDPENVEKLQAMCDKLKIEFTGFDAACEAIAARKYDRIAVLMRTLNNNLTVTHLDCSRNGLGAPNAEGRSNYQTLRRLGNVIDDSKKLQVLDLSGNNMGPQGVGIIAKALTKNITIHTVNLSGNDLAGDAPDEDDDPENEEGDPVFGEINPGLDALAELVKKSKFIKTLSLRNNRLKGEVEPEGEDDGFDTPLGKFLDPLRKYHRIETLDLASNELGPGGARMVYAALATNRSIRALDISDNSIGIAGLPFITKLLQENSTLTTLAAQRNAITFKRTSKRQTKHAMEVFASFAAALAGNTALTSLDLSGHHFGVDVSQALLKDFEKSAITSLRYESNNMCGSPDTAEADTTALMQLLAATQRADNPLRELFVASNRILAAGAECIAAAMNPSLHALDVARNGIGNTGAAAIAKALAVPGCALRQLNLAFNSITDAAPLATALPKVGPLVSLNLSNNRVGHDATAFLDLINAIGHGALLRDVDLSSNALGTAPEHVDALESLCVRAQPPLTRLELLDNPNISLSDTNRILVSLGSNDGLRAITVSSQAGDRAALVESLLRTLERNSKLVDVNLCFGKDQEDEDALNAIADKLLYNALTGVELSH